ncbi:hypothetical protein [Aliamphritea spongicola]|nr:hypothetical protein [Aliamphritea spongicola]
MLQFSEKFRVLAAGVLGLVITMGWHGLPTPRCWALCSSIRT